MQELSQRASRPYMPSNIRLYSDLASSSSSTTLPSWYAASAGFLTLMTPVFFNLRSITLASNSPKKDRTVMGFGDTPLKQYKQPFRFPFFFFHRHRHLLHNFFPIQ